jgi:PAS domain S-box-containing protein
MTTEASGQNLNGAAVDAFRRMSPSNEQGVLASVPGGQNLSSTPASSVLASGEPATADAADREALISELRHRLDEATRTLEAIQSGSVDAVVVNGPNGPQIFSLEGPDHPFRTFVESMQEGALTLSRDGTILYANGFFAAMCGRAVHELLGTELASLVVPDERAACAALIAHGLAAPFKQALRLESPDGGLPVQFTSSPLTTGESATCCAVVFDLREREQAERARLGRQAAEEANAAKDRFLAVLGHEMRTPLNTVLGWAQILGRRSNLEPDALKAIKTIERNAQAQAQLIADLLDISRIVNGKLELQFETVDLGAVVSSTVEASKLRLDKELAIRHSVALGETFVRGDATRLAQVMTNLLGNAVKFTESGWIDVQLVQDDQYAQLSVTDTGIGLAADQMEGIFELFQQAPSSRHTGGLGIGLSVTKQLVEAHGGQIWVSSRGLGKGSTFVVRLPRIKGAPPLVEEDDGAGLQLTDRSILVIDDDADLLELVRHELEHRGARVDAVQTAAAALDRLCGHNYDVLLSDLGLPDQDGLELLRAARERGRSGAKLRAVALTGYGTEADARSCASAGFELHLVKPITPRDLATAIIQLLERPPILG